MNPVLVRVLAYAHVLVAVAGCGKPPALVAPPDRPVTGAVGGPASTKLAACEESMTVSLVLMGEATRADLARRLEEGVVLVTMPACDGTFWVTEDCRAEGRYRASDELVTSVERVRTEADAARFFDGKQALRARPSGFDVAVRGAVFKLDGQSLGDPAGGHCGQVTHIVTAAMLGASRLAEADSAAVEFPEAGAVAPVGPVKTAGDPEACRRDGVRSPDCRVLLAVHLRAVNAKGDRTRGVPEGGPTETGIIAPH